MTLLTEGPTKADVLIILDAPTHEARLAAKPIKGYSSKLLTELLHAIDQLRTEVRIITLLTSTPTRGDSKTHFLTKTAASKLGLIILGGKYPSQEFRDQLPALTTEIAQCKPKTIIPMGDLALFALTGEISISKWRGSELSLRPIWDGPYDPSIRVLPTYSPMWISKVWEEKYVAQHDLDKAFGPRPEEPNWQFSIPTEFQEARASLQRLLQFIEAFPGHHIAADIETRENKYIDCIGFAGSRHSALTIPFFRASTYEPIFSIPEEVELIFLIKQILTHPNIRLVGQNWAYDRQYIARLWGFDPKPSEDTMLMQGVLFPGTPKSLDYLSSLYRPWHRYWKDDTADAEATADDNIRWEYNCKDCCATWEIVDPMLHLLEKYDLMQQYQFKMRSNDSVFRAMLRGVRQDQALRGPFMNQLMAPQHDLEGFFERLQEEAFPDIILAKSKTAKPWYRSPQQQVKLFYHELKLPPQYHKKTKRPTADDNALKALAKKEPLFKPVLDLLGTYRSIGVFLSTFILVKLDHDQRMRCSYGVVGTETFRLNSSADVFRFGGNLQNIPAGDD